MKLNNFRGLRLSQLGLGGHEFLPDGRVKAMGEDFYTAVKAGFIWEGFGQQNRRETLNAALQGGVNFLDVTMDCEKEALGRNLRELSPSQPTYVQTRPEGMVYNNDPSDVDKSKLLDYGLLKAEAEHACGLLGRNRIDFYNIGLFAPAIQRQPGYLPKLARNIERLKADGLIQFACVDTLTGEALSLEMIATGAFDAVFTAFGIANDAALRKVIPAAVDRGMAIFLREAFMKGRLFSLAASAGISDRSRVARAAVRWILAHDFVTALVVGAAGPDQVIQSLQAAEQPALTDDDQAVLDAIQHAPDFAATKAGQLDFFVKGWG
ncbi:MAG: aldo/keto reductase [Armatimonadota bacterium]